MELAQKARISNIEGSLNVLRLTGFKSFHELDVVSFNPYDRKMDPPEVLKTKSEEVKTFDENVYELLEAMKNILEINGAVGIAAPQIGIPARVIVADINYRQIELINPEIIEDKGCRFSLEGCMSVKGTEGIVRRPRQVVVKAQDINGNEKIIKAKGFDASVLSHEIDHLNGVLYIDKAFCKYKKFFN